MRRRNIIGQNIRKIRESKDLTQENLAYEINVSKGTISKIEAGTYNTSMKHFEAIGKALEVDVFDFLKEPRKEKEYKILEETDPVENYRNGMEMDFEKLIKMTQVLIENDKNNKVAQDNMASLLTNLIEELKKK